LDLLMAFSLSRRRGRISKQLRRLTRKELSSALDELRRAGPDQDAIHEARKSIKKVRAVLRLLKKPLGADYGVEDQRLRSAARGLSSLRDADATLETLRFLHGEYPTVITSSLIRRVGRGLQIRKQHARGQAGPIIAHAKGTLARSKKSVPKHIGRIAQFKAVRSGAVRGYRKARTALHGLSVDSDATGFHDWRKRVKDHWYHVRLFEGLHTGPRTRVKTLERLEAWLGTDHDLAVLRAIMLNGAARLGDARARTLVLGGITKSQVSLRRRALTLGHRTFNHAPTHFEASVTMWWRGHS
jgi:CHAD domain-containing protein